MSSSTTPTRNSPESGAHPDSLVIAEPATLQPATPDMLKVLIVEDSVVERTRLATLINRYGYQVIEARDGEQARQILADQHIDIVISDWVMPGISGLELCKEITRNLSLNQPYFIMLTGQQAQTDLIAAMDAGADDFIVKPANQEELRVRLQAGMRSLHLRKSLQQRNAELDESLLRERQEMSRLQKDLVAAAELQHSLLPEFSEFPETLDAAYVYQPANTVGGDALGMQALGENLYNFFVLDVCGHGIASAMQSIGLARRLSPLETNNNLIYDNEKQRWREPDDVVSRLNALQCTQPEVTDFFTLAYGTIDAHTGLCRLCLAGHPYPLLIGADGQAQWLNHGGGLPIGISSEASYQSFEFQMEPGDTLLVFTDGIIEHGQRGRESDYFASELAERLASLAPASPKEVVTAIRTWLAPLVPADDAAALVLRRQDIQA